MGQGQRRLLETARRGPRRETQSVGGVDVGISPLAVDSDGVHYKNPKALESALRRLRRWQRAQARRMPRSRSWREHNGASTALMVCGTTPTIR